MCPFLQIEKVFWEDPFHVFETDKFSGLTCPFSEERRIAFFGCKQILRLGITSPVSNQFQDCDIVVLVILKNGQGSMGKCG